MPLSGRNSGGSFSHVFFLDSGMMSQLSMISLNINGATSKLEERRCIELLTQYDIICLSEIKCDYPFSMPGYRCIIRSCIIPGEEKRGGVAVLFKECIWNSVHDIVTVKDQVWFSVRCFQNSSSEQCTLPLVTLFSSAWNPLLLCLPKLCLQKGM